MSEREVMKRIYANNLQSGGASLRGVAADLDVPEAEVGGTVSILKDSGLVKGTESRLEITEEGRQSLKVVFIGGAFEVIHAGHLYTIEKAKGLGDFLVVVVARDITVRKRKKRDPVAPETERVRVVAGLKKVDAAILGSETNIYETLEKVKPDIVALGYDQYHGEEEISREAKKRGLTLTVVRLDSPFPGIKTSKIIAEL
ncbi:MAG: FAD synthase [Thaumarchaeota archaeon]|nr:FAD synthase [Nitrososphaerota archaeon]